MEARAVEAHTQMLLVEANVERLVTGTTERYMVECERTESLHESIKLELAGAADDMRTAGTTVRAFDGALLGPKGLAAQVLNAFTGAGGVVSTTAEKLLGSDGVLAIVNTRLFGLGGLIETTDKHVQAITAGLEKSVHAENGIVARVNQKLNGKGGAAAQFDASVRGTTSDVVAANNAMVETANEVTKLLGRVKFMAGLLIVTFAAGAFGGVALFKFAGSI